MSLLLAILMLLSVTAVFASCGETNEDTQQTKDPLANTESEGESVDTRFDGINYDGREFRIYTSTNVSTMGKGNSNFLIEGTGETEGGLVNDAVLERNIQVEDLLGVELVFTQADLTYAEVAGDLRKYTQSGDDVFDLVINDIYAYAELIIEGNFRNVLDDECVFDFEREYWYKDYMEDLRLVNGGYNRPLGQGDCRFAESMTILRDSAYAGWIIDESEVALKGLENNVRTLRGFFCKEAE
jgi:hypothetical protein